MANFIGTGVDPKFKMFNQQWGHFESPESKRRILNLIEACGLIDEMKRVKKNNETLLSEYNKIITCVIDSSY